MVSRLVWIQEYCGFDSRLSDCDGASGAKAPRVVAGPCAYALD